MCMQSNIDSYCALPCVFDDFFGCDDADDGEIALFCSECTPENTEKKHVPAYSFLILKDGAPIGTIGLRVGISEALFYCGNIGYYIEESYRGHGRAARACRLLIPLMRAHRMRAVTISTSEDNAASVRTCENLGARMLGLYDLPEWTELYAQGERRVRVFLWDFGA